MSERAVTLGVVKRLRDAFGDSAGEFVHDAPDLKPPQAACSFRDSPFLVTVGRASSSPGPVGGGDADDQVYTVQVCVTAWLAYAPADRQGAELDGPVPDPLFAEVDPPTDLQVGAKEVADRVKAYLIKSYPAIADMDSYIAGVNVTTNGFIEPFKTCTVGDAQPQPPSWIGSDDQSEAKEIWTVTLTLGGARRVRVQGTL